MDSNMHMLMRFCGDAGQRFPGLQPHVRRALTYLPRTTQLLATMKAAALPGTPIRAWRLQGRWESLRLCPIRWTRRLP